MKASSILYIIIGCMLTTVSVKAYGRNVSYCVEPSRAKDGEHGVQDGEHGQDGEDGKNGQDGGHGGNGGTSTLGNGGNGGNGGDAD